VLPSHAVPTQMALQDGLFLLDIEDSGAAVLEPFLEVEAGGNHVMNARGDFYLHHCRLCPQETRQVRNGPARWSPWFWAFDLRPAGPASSAHPRDDSAPDRIARTFLGSGFSHAARRQCTLCRVARVPGSTRYSTTLSQRQS